ncbi:MAG TPA: GNAT family N-acetyltransferase [Anaerolineae bacterium]|nr:GNAT family N-acetyltransferase [Anaerolineae bacterium]
MIDRDHIRIFLETDREWSAYALGDLDPELYQECEWFGAEDNGRLRSIVLLFKGLEPPVIFTIGEASGIDQILDRLMHARSVYLSIREDHLRAIETQYHLGRRESMWRMILKPSEFRSIEGEAIDLQLADIDDLTCLYALGGGDAFTRSQLSSGVFYGLRKKDRIAAVAGTHVVSIEQSVAAVGNIMTHPDDRHHGYASIVTSAVCAELIRRGIRTIALNVSQSNLAAIRVYEKLGFKKYVHFYEGIALRKETKRS